MHAALTGVAEELGEEIRRSLDYYMSQDYAAGVGRLVVTGRGALLRNLGTYLSGFLTIPVEVGNPLAKISQNGSGQPDEFLTAVAPRLAVAVGLALDEVD